MAMSMPRLGDEPAFVQRIFVADGAAPRTRNPARNPGKASPAVQRTRPTAMSRARFSVSATGMSSARVGTRWKPPGLTLDGMDFAPAEHAHQLVAGLLQRKRVADEIAVIARHLDRVRAAQKIRRVQHRDVQRMALESIRRNRSAAAAPGAGRSTLDAEGVFDRHEPRPSDRRWDRCRRCAPRCRAARCSRGRAERLRRSAAARKS